MLGRRSEISSKDLLKLEPKYVAQGTPSEHGILLDAPSVIDWAVNVVRIKSSERMYSPGSCQSEVNTGHLYISSKLEHRFSFDLAQLHRLYSGVPRG